jgi:hypothetical protein
MTLRRSGSSSRLPVWRRSCWTCRAKTRKPRLPSPPPCCAQGSNQEGLNNQEGLDNRFPESFTTTRTKCPTSAQDHFPPWSLVRCRVQLDLHHTCDRSSASCTTTPQIASNLKASSRYHAISAQAWAQWQGCVGFITARMIRMHLPSPVRLQVLILGSWY